MSSGYLTNKENIKSIITKYLLALLPLIIAGFYKNGIKLYIADYVGIMGMLKPLVYDALGFIIGALVNIIYETIIKKNKDILKSIFSSFHPLYGILIASIISINTKIYIFVPIAFTALMISKFIKKNILNITALSALIIIFIEKFTTGFSFLNAYEASSKLNLVALDYLIGRGSGGINTAHVILLIISLLLLCQIKSYKREIPLYSAVVYSLFMIIYCIFTNNVGNILDNIFSNGILFSYIFIASDSVTSSYTETGKIIYSLIIGIATFGLFLIYPPLSAIGAILIASISHSTIDRIVINLLKIKNKKLRGQNEKVS